MSFLRKFLFYTFLLTGYLPLFGMTVTLFNVGQGNGTLITFPNKPSMLIDLGTSQSAGEESPKKNKENIIKRALQALEKADSKELIIIASHSDQDHCNLITEFAQRCLQKKYELKVILGGRRAHYENKDFGQSFKELEENCSSFEYRKGIKEFKEFCKTHLPDYCSILAAETKNKESNDNSIVVRVADGTFSCLLLGDATKKITENLKAEDLASEVVVLSHHGAETHGCTTAELLEKINPSYIVVSAGMYGGKLHHPRALPIIHSVDHLKRKTILMKPHMVNYFDGKKEEITTADKKVFKPIIKYNDGYAVGLTQTPVYNTTNEGDIIITRSSIKYTQPSYEETKKDTALNALHRTYAFGNKTYDFDTITNINLSNLNLQDTDLSNLTLLPHNLACLNLCKNKFTVQTIASCAKLLKDHQQKTTITFDMEYNKDDKRTDPILQKLKEKEKLEKIIRERTLHALKRIKNSSNNSFSTRAKIGIPLKK